MNVKANYEKGKILAPRELSLSEPKIFEWLERMGRREPTVGDYVRWVQGDLK